MVQVALIWMFRVVPLAMMVLILSNCTMLGLNFASLETEGKPAPTPMIDARSQAEWEADRAALMADFERHVYGPWPAGTPVERVSRRMADPDYYGGRATLEEIEVAIGGASFRLGLAIPKGVEGPLPVVVGQTFSSNCAVFASTALLSTGGAQCASTDVPGFVKYIFGEHIAHPPLGDYFDAGFAYASYHASDVVRDDAGAAPADLATFAARGGQAPTGAIMAWAYAYSAAVDVLSQDDRLDGDRIAVFGHSRHGKSALVAGAWDPRIAAVVSHQSGYGGAALSRSTTGEGVRQMTRGARVMPFVSLPGYPHWFDPAYGAYSGRLDELPVDQHQLLALIAPRPLYLGNARRDVWSDPNATFRAAEAASVIYGHYGAEGLGANGMRSYAPDDTIAYFLRPGGHGTDARDMAAILDFLKAHLGAGAETTS